MFVALDTNVFVKGGFRLNSNDFIWLTQECAAGRLTLVVPEIVIRETINLYREQAGAHETKMRSAYEALRDLKALAAENLPTLSPTHVADFEQALRAHINLINGRIPQFDDVPHETIVERALSRRKPFGNKDAGYRDTLLWEAVLRTASDGPVAFITDNVRDFATAEESLHEDLVQDLIDQGLAGDHVRLYRTLKDFVRELSQSNAAIATKVQALVEKEPNMRARFITKLEDAVTGWNVYSVPPPERVDQFFGADVSPESVTITPIDEFKQIEISDARGVADGPALIEVSAVAATDLTGLMHKADYYSRSEDEYLVRIKNPDWNEHYMEVSVTTELVYVFEARFDEQTSGLSDVRAISVDRSDR